jgi:hypothetical protein
MHRPSDDVEPYNSHHFEEKLFNWHNSLDQHGEESGRHQSLDDVVSMRHEGKEVVQELSGRSNLL